MLSTGQSDAIARIYRGHEPRLGRVADIAATFGYELVMVPKGGGPPVSDSGIYSHDGSEKVREFPLEGSGGLELVESQKLAELLTDIVEDWEASNEHGRGKLLVALRPHIADQSDQKSKARRLVRWLGWESQDE